jgi:signal transduction histidine kinase/CheY-like chemotaxis protein
MCANIPNGDNSPYPWKKGRIVVADDSPTVLNMLQAMLENEGYEVMPAMDGVEAITKIYQEVPDLVVLDIFMPRINGYQVCRLLKYDEITSHIPIIMLTGSERGDKFWSLETGADEFRTKDFEFGGLIESIERLLKPVTRNALQVTSPPGDEIQILSKLSHLLDRQLYDSTIEKIRLATILDSLGEGVFAIDSDKKIVEFNRSLQQMTGLSREQVLGKECADVINIPLCSEGCLFDRVMEQKPESRRAKEPESQRACLPASAASFLKLMTSETEIEGQGGIKVPVNLYLTLLEDHVGKIVGAVCVCRDITRMREIERINDELSKAYRDLQDTQDQLIQSEKMASLGRLVAGATHELNNPISFIYSNVPHLREYIRDIKTILGKYDDTIKSLRSLESSDDLVPAYAGIFNDSIEDIEKLKEELGLDYTIEDLDRLVDDIDEGARRTKVIVEDLRAFSRSDEGKIEDTDINEDMEKSLSLLVDHYKGRITIHKDYGDLPRVKCYAGQIGQVFMNLIGNACQAVEDEGDVWITTRMETQAPAEPESQKAGLPETVVVRIRDNGVGIPSDTIDKVFDPFFTTKDVGEGAGLGLSVSYGIIERHKGEISVDSEVGSGTTFTVRIPVDFEIGS